MLIIKIYLLSAQTYWAHTSCHRNYRAALIASFPWSSPCERLHWGCETWQHCTIPGKRCLCSSWEQVSITSPQIFQPFLYTCVQITDVKDQGELMPQREEQPHLQLLEPSPNRASAQGALVVFFPLFAWFCFGLAAIGEILTGHFQINICNEPRFRFGLPDHWVESIKYYFQGGSQIGKCFAQVLLWTFWERCETFRRREQKDSRCENSQSGSSCKISESWISLAAD